MLLHAGRTLACMHLVFNRKKWCRQWSTVQLVVEIGKCYPKSIFLRLDKRLKWPRVDKWSFSKDNVCNGIIFHNDLHDLGMFHYDLKISNLKKLKANEMVYSAGRIWKCCSWDGQWEGFYHLHDDYCRLGDNVLLLSLYDDLAN